MSLSRHLVNSVEIHILKVENLAWLDHPDYSSLFTAALAVYRTVWCQRSLVVTSGSSVESGFCKSPTKTHSRLQYFLFYKKEHLNRIWPVTSVFGHRLVNLSCNTGWSEFDAMDYLGIRNRVGCVSPVYGAHGAGANDNVLTFCVRSPKIEFSPVFWLRLFPIPIVWSSS